MAFVRRNGNAFQVANSTVQPGSDFRVTVLPAGATASQTSTGTTITVDSGHGFQAGDRLIVNYDELKFRYVVSKTATTIVVNEAVSVSSGDLIINLRDDTGTTAPEYDGSDVVIYSDMDGGTVVGNSTVTANSGGDYGYWLAPQTAWELIRDTNGNPVDLVINAVEDSLLGSGGSITNGVLTTTTAVVTSGQIENLNGIRFVGQFATAGSGTVTYPWTGWESAFSGIPYYGSHIIFEPGYYTKNSDIRLPVNLSGKLRVGGYGAQIKLTANNFPLFAIATHSNYDVARNYVLEGIQIDGNQISGSPSLTTPVLIGPDYTTRRYLNWADNVIRDITMTNLHPSGRITGIALSTQHTTDDEATQTYCRDILIENVRQEGGINGIMATVGTDSAGSSANHIYSRLTIRKHYHANNAAPTAFDYGANVQLGSDGVVRDTVVEDCYWKNSVDVGIEVDNAENVTVKNCVAEDAWVANFYVTNFGTNANQGKCLIKFENCTSRLTSGMTQTAENVGSAFKVGGTSTTNTKLGQIYFDSCHAENFTTLQPLTYYALGYWRQLNFTNCSYFAPYLKGSTLPGVRNVFYIGQDDDSVVKISNFNSKWVVDADASVTMCQIRHLRCVGGRIDVDGFYVSGMFTNNATSSGSIFIYSSPEQAGYSNKTDAYLNNLVIQQISGASSTGANNTMIYIVDDTASDSQILVQNCDFSALPSGSRYLFFQETADRPAVIYRDNLEDGTNRITGKTVTAASSITLPYSCDFVQVSGTTSITSITASYPGRRVTLMFQGTASSTGLTDGSNLVLAGNLAFTPNDTITLVCDGTNWVELARSVN